MTKYNVTITIGKLTLKGEIESRMGYNEFKLWVLKQFTDQDMIATVDITSIYPVVA